LFGVFLRQFWVSCLHTVFCCDSAGAPSLEHDGNITHPVVSYARSVLCTSIFVSLFQRDLLSPNQPFVSWISWLGVYCSDLVRPENFLFVPHLSYSPSCFLQTLSRTLFMTPVAYRPSNRAPPPSLPPPTFDFA